MSHPRPTAAACLDALGLHRAPFPPTPDADGYFFTGRLERELAEAAHCLLARKGFVLLTGEVGLGKTTFLRRLLAAVEREGATTSLVFNTFLQGPQLLAAILRDLGLPGTGEAAADIDRLNGFLLRRWRDGATCVLAIDDAQNLSIESLELLRLLSNLESGQEKLLQVVLAGQPELGERLAQPGIRQLASRIVKHVPMAPLGAGETALYVAFRLAQAGAQGIALTVPAQLALHRLSRGNPRRIHLIMDRCLYGLVARGTRTVDTMLVRQAAAEAGFAGRRRWPWRSVGGVLLLATGLAAAGAGLRREATPPPPVPVTTSAAATHAPAVRDAWNDCLARLAAGGGQVQLLRLPAGRAHGLADRPDVCVDAGARVSTIAYVPGLRSARLAGAAADEVRALQTALLPLDAALAVDGRFGPRTRAALARFQQDHGLPPSGRPDPTTLLLLDAASARAAAHPNPEPAHGRG